MGPFRRLLVAFSVALILAGAAGVVTRSVRPAPGSAVGAARRAPPAAARPGRPAPSVGTDPSAASTTIPGPPPEPTAVLRSDLITPTDMGGYYRSVPGAASSLLDSTSCLTPVKGPGRPVGRAATSLLGPDSYSMPTVVEEVTSYPVASSRAGYEEAVSGMQACHFLSFDFEGAVVSARVALSTIAPVGDADTVWAGSFGYGPDRFSIQVGLVLDGPDVVLVVWMDPVPPLNPIMGDFASTVSLAVGKLA